MWIDSIAFHDSFRLGQTHGNGRYTSHRKTNVVDNAAAKTTQPRQTDLCDCLRIACSDFARMGIVT